MLYAKAAGYADDVIDYDDITTFLECLRVNHHALKGENAKRAKTWIEKDIEFAIKSEYWEHFFFSPLERNEEKDGYKEVQALRKAALKANLKSLWTAQDDSIGAYALSKAIALKRDDLDKIYTKLEERKETLKPLLSRALASGKNKYGETEYEKYFKEINDFFDYFLPEGELSFYNTVKPLMETAQYLDNWFTDGFVDTTTLPENGIEFEHWCAAKLEEQGWITKVSQASGDQGVDIEARRGDFVVAIQCKRYAQPIGNKAVQEVYTGAKNINANAAAVIGTGGYTKSAFAVASTTSVELIDAAEIESFSERFGLPPEFETKSSSMQAIKVNFSSMPERMLALMFRTALKQFDVTDLNVTQSFKNNFFENIDERGVGIMDFEATELASLLIFSNFIFPASFKLTPENINSLKKHDYPMLQQLEQDKKNDNVQIFELIGDDILNDVRNVFIRFIALLPIEIDLEDHFLFSE